MQSAPSWQSLFVAQGEQSGAPGAVVPPSDGSGGGDGGAAASDGYAGGGMGDVLSSQSSKQES